MWAVNLCVACFSGILMCELSMFVVVNVCTGVCETAGSKRRKGGNSFRLKILKVDARMA